MSIEKKDDGGLVYRDSQGNKLMESSYGNDLSKYYAEGINETGVASTDIVNPRQISTERIKKFLDELTDEERRELFTYYCHECGTKDVPCRCWDDT